MQLTTIERLLLRNQLEILKHLQAPLQSTASYDEHIAILEAGYEVFYDEVLLGVSETATPVSVTKEVLDILDLYRALDNAKRNGVTIPAGGPYSYPDFVGFDGNNEGEHLRFARFLIDVQGKYVESGPSKNSHHHTLSTYQGMLQRWKANGQNHKLSQAEVDAIVI